MRICPALRRSSSRSQSAPRICRRVSPDGEFESRFPWKAIVMITKVVLPKWGMGIEEGTIVRWLKAAGDAVEKGEPIVEVETAKATQEVEAPTSGTLVEIVIAEGQAVAVNTEIARIETDHG
jgi:multidrug efflux pump subunit AcrA (membrane-fusion protein)